MNLHIDLNRLSETFDAIVRQREAMPCHGDWQQCICQPQHLPWLIEGADGTVMPCIYYDACPINHGGAEFYTSEFQDLN